mmetsp:Transcript_36567/g.66370  ORF Transcript_36567/g.66370 Transcript_36567/m.66370 type:complete len:225 (-) Transcript_36567:27-701(-)
MGTRNLRSLLLKPGLGLKASVSRILEPPGELLLRTLYRPQLSECSTFFATSRSRFRSWRNSSKGSGRAPSRPSKRSSATACSVVSTTSYFFLPNRAATVASPSAGTQASRRMWFLLPYQSAKALAQAAISRGSAASRVFCAGQNPVVSTVTPKSSRSCCSPFTLAKCSANSLCRSSPTLKSMTMPSSLAVKGAPHCIFILEIMAFSASLLKERLFSSRLARWSR